MDRLRNQLGRISRTAPAPTSATQQADNSGDQQADDPGDQLSSDVQDLEQDLDNLFDGFNSDQQTAVAAQIKDLKKKTSQLAEWSQQLKADLANKNSDPKKIQEAVRRIDKLTKQIQKEQRAVAAALGIEG
jgi:predicted RNase H-like nuclease (RuvC/YqgF family)